MVRKRSYNEKSFNFILYIYTCATDYNELLFPYVYDISKSNFLYFDGCKFCTLILVARENKTQEKYLSSSYGLFFLYVAAYNTRLL